MTPIELMHAVSPPVAGEQTNLRGFRLMSDPLRHRRFDSGIYKIAELHHARRAVGCGGGVLIRGPAGAGKTVLASSYAQRFVLESSLNGTHIPVLVVTVPSSPTAKSLGEA